MKKLIRIGTVVLIFGIIMFVAGMTMLEWDFLALDTEELTQKEHVYSDWEQLDEINLEIYVESTRVKIVRSDTLKVVYYDGDNMETSASEIGKPFTFQQKYKRKFRIVMFQGIKRWSKYTEIHIPSDKKANINVETKNGEILATNSGEYGSINLKSSNSSITLGGTTASGNITLSSTNGNINLSNCVAKDITLKSSNGSLNIQNVTCTNLTADTSNGKITAMETSAESKLRLDTSNGKIEIGSIESPDIYLDSSNGSIKGSIVGEIEDYSITSKTSNGSNNLSNKPSIGGKSLKVYTSNGNINVVFVSKLVDDFASCHSGH